MFDFVYLFPGLSLWMQKNVLSLGSGRTLLMERFSGAMLVPALVLVFGYLPTLTSLFPTLNHSSLERRLKRDVLLALQRLINGTCMCFSLLFSTTSDSV